MRDRNIKNRERIRIEEKNKKMRNLKRVMNKNDKNINFNQEVLVARGD